MKFQLKKEDLLFYAGLGLAACLIIKVVDNAKLRAWADGYRVGVKRAGCEKGVDYRYETDH